MAKQVFDERGYFTKRSLTQQIHDRICEKHGLSKSQVLINWLTTWKITKYPNGLVEKVGIIRLHAEGFDTRNFTVYQKAHHRWFMDCGAAELRTYGTEIAGPCDASHMGLCC